MIKDALFGFGFAALSVLTFCDWGHQILAEEAVLKCYESYHVADSLDTDALLCPAETELHLSGQHLFVEGFEICFDEFNQSVSCSDSGSYNSSFCPELVVESLLENTKVALRIKSAKSCVVYNGDNGKIEKAESKCFMWMIISNKFDDFCENHRSELFKARDFYYYQVLLDFGIFICFSAFFIKFGVDNENDVEQENDDNEHPLEKKLLPQENEVLFV